MRRFRRLGWAALASLVLHVALLALLWEEAPPRARPAPAATPPPLAVEILTLPRAEPPRVPPVPPAERPVRPPPRPPTARPPSAAEPPVKTVQVPPPPEAAAEALDEDAARARAEAVAEPPASAVAEAPRGAVTGIPSKAEAESPSEAAAVTPSTAAAEMPSEAVAGAPASAPVPGTERAGGPDGAASPEQAPTVATAPDAPRRHLQDRSPFALPPSLAPGGNPLPGPPSQSGRTLRPGDPSLSPDVLAAQEHARVSGRVEGFVGDQQAHLRVANGLIDPYFSRLREALEKGLDGAPVFGGTSLAHQAATSWADQAGRFGSTGNPGTGPVPAAPTVTEQLSNLQQRARDKGTETAVETLRARVQAGEQMQTLAGGGGNKLVVTLELFQAPDGALREVKLISRSGNPAYDAYVLGAVPPALARLAPPPGEARGVKPEGIHTLWSVEGRVVYLRKLQELEGQDAWYMAAAAAAGVLAGRFEETTGEIEVIDFRHPRFVLKPELLRVY